MTLIANMAPAANSVWPRRVCAKAEKDKSAWPDSQEPSSRCL